MKGDRNLSFQALSVSLQNDGQLFTSTLANPDTCDEWRVQSGDVTLCLFILPRFSSAWFGGTEERLGSRGRRGWLEPFFCSSSELWVERKRVTGSFYTYMKGGRTKKENKAEERVYIQEIRPERKMLGPDGDAGSEIPDL
ncbi:hypothetical protein ROHU_008544 [Labeo rohita]|uniref:Uncharacterized protein n=1 Tax=Labeo rohita TaxID=84645 RepID=A0A498MG24_LABRO|nr:hypothetical protein ROHU_008544 [Labeo rohita]